MTDPGRGDPQSPVAPARVLEVLSGPTLRRFLGPGPPADQLTHALAFAAAAEQLLGRPPARCCDLGTGGGVPGMVLASCWPETRTTMVDAAERRCAALRRAIVELRMEPRAAVRCGRAEQLAHEPELRETFDVVTARSFARPAVTAEIAAGLVAVGGGVLVSDPPEPDPDRWPAAPLAELGLAPARAVVAGGVHFTWLAKRVAAPPGIPHPDGRIARRARW